MVAVSIREIASNEAAAAAGSVPFAGKGWDLQWNPQHPRLNGSDRGRGAVPFALKEGNGGWFLTRAATP